MIANTSGAYQKFLTEKKCQIILPFNLSPPTTHLLCLYDYFNLSKLKVNSNLRLYRNIM